MIRVKSFKWDRICNSSTPHNVRANLLQIDVLAKKHGWTIIKYHPNNYVLNLVRENVKMNVYLSTMAIQTAMNHPRAGKTQLNRKNLTKKELERIFISPRVHTNKGYYIKD